MEVKVNGKHDSITPVGVSQLGTPIFDNVVFPPGKYFDLSNIEHEYEEVKLDAVTMVVTRPKQIVKSSIAGRNGEISEHVGFGNYSISLNAILAPKALGLGEDTELLGRIKKLDDVPERVAIQSKFLNNIFGITYVIIEELEIAKIISDSYSIRMLMYGDFELDLKGFG